MSLTKDEYMRLIMNTKDHKYMIRKYGIDETQNATKNDQEKATLVDVTEEYIEELKKRYNYKK